MGWVLTDNYFLDGCAAVWNIIDQLSLVGDQSNYFKSDILQFLHLKRSSKETVTVSPVATTLAHTEIKCHIQSLLINFCHTKEDSVELISKADVQFNCSASLINDSLVSLDLGFSSLALYSHHDSLVLAKCTLACLSTLVLDISFSKSFEGENVLSVCLPSLNIWLHFSEWIEVVDYFNQFSEHLAKTVLLDSSLNGFSSNNTAGTKDPHFAAEEMKETVFLTLKSDMVGVTVHTPVWFSEETDLELQLADDLRFTSSSVYWDIAEERNTKFLSVSFHMKCFELLASSRGIQLKTNIDKLSCLIVITEDKLTSWPIFEIVQVYLNIATCTNQKDTREFKLEILCDHSDVWLSHPVFYFFSAVNFNVPKAPSSQFSSCGVDFKFQLRKVSFLLTDGRVCC